VASKDRAREAKSTGLIRLSRSYGAVLLVVLGLLAAAALLIPSKMNLRPASPEKVGSASPEVEGQPVEALFGLHQGQLRYYVRKRSKHYMDRVLRITGTVEVVQSPTSEIKIATLQKADGGASVSLMFRVQFEPDFARLSPGMPIRAACVFRGEIDAEAIRFEDCSFSP
jgi:hypothetical protein